MKNILFEQKKVKLWNKWHLVENKAEVIQNVLRKSVNFLIAWICVFSSMHMHMQILVFLWNEHCFSLKYVYVIVYVFTGGFLSDAGWFAESEKVLLACQDLCRCTEPCIKYWFKLLECYHKYVSFIGENAIYYSLYLVEFVDAVFIRRKFLSFWMT